MWGQVDTNNKCTRQCKEGYIPYTSGATGCFSCTVCDAGDFLSPDLSCERDHCQSCTTCAHPQFTSSPCTITSDAQCALCKEECEEGQVIVSLCTTTAQLVCRACASCPPGKVQITSCEGHQDTECADCPANSYCANGQSNLCPPNSTTRPQDDASTIMHCVCDNNVSTVSPDTNQCQAVSCAQNTYRHLRTCVPCPQWGPTPQLWTTSTADATSLDECQCPPGYYGRRVLGVEGTLPQIECVMCSRTCPESADGLSRKPSDCSGFEHNDPPCECIDHIPNGELVDNTTCRVECASEPSIQANNDVLPVYYNSDISRLRFASEITQSLSMLGDPNECSQLSVADIRDVLIIHPQDTDTATILLWFVVSGSNAIYETEFDPDTSAQTCNVKFGSHGTQTPISCKQKVRPTL